VTNDDDSGRQPPSDVGAERFLLACLMNGSPVLVEEVAQLVAPDDFYRPGHQEIFRAAIALYAAREPVDPVTVWDWLAHNDGLAAIGSDRMYLHNVFDLTVIPQAGLSYARIIRQAAVLRRCIEESTRMAQRAYQPDADPADLIVRWERALRDLSRETVEDWRAPGPSSGLASQAKAMAQKMVFPGLLGHEDRVIAVGLEGDGKTTLAFQMAHCLAAGIHPFTFTPITPGRALMIDLENPRGHLAGQLSWLGDLAASYPGWDPERLWVWSHPAGINLKDPRDVMKVADVIRRARPDFVYAGPKYKMLEDDGEESSHAFVTRFWDRMRALHGFAFWMEDHVPLHMFRGDRIMRPLGSGIYTRWPEFGFALTRHRKEPGTLILDRFRGDRIKGRCWPDKFTRTTFGTWPWSAVYPDGTLELGHHDGEDQ
jgi:hypothetical protein